MGGPPAPGEPHLNHWSAILVMKVNFAIPKVMRVKMKVRMNLPRRRVEKQKMMNPLKRRRRKPLKMN